MCDTVVVTGERTTDGVTLFANNSDREPGEAQLVELHTAECHLPGARLRCSYVEVAQLRAGASLHFVTASRAC